jgi:hypothetical protein
MRRNNGSLRTALATVACATALTCAAAPASGAILSRSTEISMGREAAQSFEATAVLDNDPVLTAKIKRIGSRLVSISDAPDYPYEFHLVDSPQVNAFALPGGFIYIYRGLVQLLPNDDALAFVMGHEIGHVARRHSVKQMEKNLIISTILNALLPRSQGAQILDLVLSMHFSRADETEADTVGIRMAARAGFDVAQGAEAMRVIRRAAGSGRGIPKLLRSHPLPDDRIARLTKMAGEMKAARRTPDAGEGEGESEGDGRTASERLAAIPTSTIGGLDGHAVAPCRYFPLKTGARWVYRTQGPTGAGKRTVTVLEMVPGTPAGVYRIETDLGRGVRGTQWVTTTAERVLVRSSETETWRTEYGFEEDAVAGQTAQVPLGPATEVTAGTAGSPPSRTRLSVREGGLPAVQGAVPTAGSSTAGSSTAGSSTAGSSTAGSLETSGFALCLCASSEQGGAPTRAERGEGAAVSRTSTAPAFRLAGTETVRVPAGEYETIKVECLGPAGIVKATCWFAPGVGLVKRVSDVTGTTQELETLTMPRDPSAPEPAPAPSVASSPTAGSPPAATP